MLSYILYDSLLPNMEHTHNTYFLRIPLKSWGGGSIVSSILWRQRKLGYDILFGRSSVQFNHRLNVTKHIGNEITSYPKKYSCVPFAFFGTNTRKVAILTKQPHYEKNVLFVYPQFLFLIWYWKNSTWLAQLSNTSFWLVNRYFDVKYNFGHVSSKKNFLLIPRDNFYQNCHISIDLCLLKVLLKFMKYFVL